MLSEPMEQRRIPENMVSNIDGSSRIKLDFTQRALQRTQTNIGVYIESFQG